MTTWPCVFCGHAAEASIPQGRVCRLHAIEFYVGLVAYAVDRSRAIAPESLKETSESLKDTLPTRAKRLPWKFKNRVNVAA
jgi:hypothetical protein